MKLLTRILRKIAKGIKNSGVSQSGKDIHHRPHHNISSHWSSLMIGI